MGPEEDSAGTRGPGEWFLADGCMVDHFQVVRPLGKGGMAEVYLARDTKLARQVALKVVKPKALGSVEAVKRFLFEARTTARFNHPNIVTVHAVGEHGGRPYVALEYIGGSTLRARLVEGGAPASIQEVTRTGLAIADALRAAHANGVLHRDLKPENVMLTDDGQLRVLDFGLARVFHRGTEAAEDPPLPPIGPIPETHESWELFESMGLNPRGTPAYMAPEQWEERETTGATDVWALGVMLFEMLTARRPFTEATVFKLAVEVCSKDAPSVTSLRPDVPAELAAMVAACLRREPARRPGADEVAQGLRALLVKDLSALSTSSDEVLLSQGMLRAAIVESAASTPVPEETQGRPSRRRALGLALLALLLVASAIAIAVWLRPRAARVVSATIDAAAPARAADLRATAAVTRDLTVAAAEGPPIRRRESRPRRPTVARSFGFLTIDATPWAVVFVDGKRLDVTPIFRRRVPAGRHLLELRNPDRALVKRLTLEIAEGAEVRRKVDLRSAP